VWEGVARGQRAGRRVGCTRTCTGGMGPPQAHTRGPQCPLHHLSQRPHGRGGEVLQGAANGAVGCTGDHWQGTRRAMGGTARTGKRQVLGCLPTIKGAWALPLGPPAPRAAHHGKLKLHAQCLALRTPCEACTTGRGWWGRSRDSGLGSGHTGASATPPQPTGRPDTKPGPRPPQVWSAIAEVV